MRPLGRLLSSPVTAERRPRFRNDIFQDPALEMHCRSVRSQRRSAFSFASLRTRVLGSEIKDSNYVCGEHCRKLWVSSPNPGWSVKIRNWIPPGSLFNVCDVRSMVHILGCDEVLRPRWPTLVIAEWCSRTTFPECPVVAVVLESFVKKTRSECFKESS